MAVTEGDILELEDKLQKRRADLDYLKAQPAAQFDGRIIALVEGLSSMLDCLETTIGYLRLPPITDESQLDWEWPDKMDMVIRDMNQLHDAVRDMRNYQGINAN